MITVLIYIFLVILLNWLNKADWYNPVFKSKGKVHWLISGMSIFMIHLSVDQGQLLTGLIAKYGMQGMWFIWSGLMGVFVIPIVFAPLWKKLNFITDNQFILFRYQGKSATFLHIFRAVYVGGLVVGLAISFHLLGFSRVVSSLFSISPNYALLITSIVLCLFALRNVLDLKLKMDVLNSVIYILSFFVILFFCFKSLQDLDYTFSYFENNIEQKNILPATGDTIAWFSFMVFLGVQWWSSNLFDGGGPEMSRFTAVKSKRSAILAGLTPILLFFVLSFLLLFQVLVILGLSGDQGVEETHYVEGVFQIIPEPFQGLVLIGFFTMFLTSSEALMNWGASFLAVDVYKGYISPEVSAKKLRKISFLIMLFISLVATLFAFQINSLQGLVKIAFSIAAGVAPVYILRWVWYRINAWSQISAMISSAFFTLIYSSFHDITPLQDFPMEETRIVFVTTSTSIIWIAITFLSKDQRRVTKEIMSKIIVSPKAFLLRLGFAILLGIILMVITASLWFYFLFW